uniref:Uncharacterized protein n=1 Tax=Avena sativa TaxID=4498 RepID=A0ACD5VLS8_AVESA
MGASQLVEQWPQFPATTIILVILPLASVLLLLHGSWKKRPGAKLPPGPWCLPMVGSLHQIGPLPHRSLSALARRHGPVMTVWLGTVPAVVLSSPEAAREALRTHDADCCSRAPSAGPRLLSYGYKDVAFSPYSDHVREMRKLFILELLSRRRVQAARHAREAQVEKLVKSLASSSGGGGIPVPIADHVFAAVDGIIGSFAFGENYAAEQFKEQFVPVLNETMDMLSSFSAEDFFPGAFGRLVDRVTGIKARRDKIFEKLDGFFEQLVDQYEDPSRRKPADDDEGCASVLVQELVDLWKKNGGEDFTREHVKAMLMNTFVGGNHTSSVTISWAMAELIRQPRVLKKVQDEIRLAAGGRRAQQEDMGSLKYLRMVVKETLRLHPPATLLVPRETTRRIQVAGHSIPAKTKVIVNAWAIGRDPGVWKDPEEFCPERFQDADIDFHGAHFQLLPFGSGRRVCPGLAMGVANIEFILANLLYCFDWELPAGVRSQDVRMEEAGALTFRKKTPLLLLPTKYEANNACH